MKVYVKAPAHLSRAMFRVERALVFHAPFGIEVVDDPDKADLHVLHVIGADALQVEFKKPYVVIQYCFKTAGGPIEGWQRLWSEAVMVWSYYDLSAHMPPEANFYMSPLGLDPAFTDWDVPPQDRQIGVVTTGYVNGPHSEAIEEVAVAADLAGLRVVHIGPRPTGLTIPLPPTWRGLLDIPDAQLAMIYRRARWVAGLRYCEGFEMPAIEGLACGARPILFDRPDMRRWYDGHAAFIPECTGNDLVRRLTRLFEHGAAEVTEYERRQIIAEFNWEDIISNFWLRVVMRRELYT